MRLYLDHYGNYPDAGRFDVPELDSEYDEAPDEDECCEICGDLLDDGACENCDEEEEEDEDA